MNSNLIEKGDNEDITSERRKANFDVNKMAAFIHGGESIVQRRHEILEAIESRQEFKNPVPLEFLSREQRHEEQARKAVLLTNVATEIIDGSDFFGEGMYYQSLIMGRDLHAMSLHYIMFIPTLQGQTDDEQLEEWLGAAISRAILGTYAQTELGHGTNLSKLETTATYDPSTKEFILHSPTITSAKWWPGGLGKSSTHAIVMAQLITNGALHGPHPFIVQLRDFKTHIPFKTISVGDIGPKLGINGSDNGFLLFNHHRIPRKNMLMRHAKVLANGEYVAPQHNKLSYGSMIFVRAIMVRDQAMQLGAAVTIAVRYSAIRRQGEMNPKCGEVQILDYQTQQYRILPQISNTIIFLLAASEIRTLYLKVTEQLRDSNIELLPELHALSSGLKAVISWEVAKGIEQCRLACGGHGYSQASAFPEIYAYAVGGCTYEGENIVMLLQVARQLVKAVRSIQQGNAKLSFIESYLQREYPSVDRHPLSNNVDAISPEYLINLFEAAAKTQIYYCVTLLEQRLKTQVPEEAWNSTSVELCKSSRKCLLDVRSMENARQAVYRLLATIRPNAVAIVDSFDFSDRELNSVLGRRDGNVYAALLDWAQKSPLNQQELTTAYTKHLRPMMEEARSKL